MWPDEDDETWDDEPEEDAAAITARVRAAYRAERARIREATDVDALRELQVEYEAELEVGALTGLAEACARDLVARIVARVDALEAAQRARIERVRREERERVARQAQREAKAREEAARRQREVAQRQAQERARRVAEVERAAEVRLANARAAEVEARAALLRAKAAQAARGGASTGARRSAAKGEARASRRPATSSPRVSEAPETTPIEEADRAALMAAGRWPPPEPRPDSPFWSPEDHWPKSWTFTGFDLAELRGRLRVTQRVFAGQLGVETVEVARAEAEPRKKVRPALQVALRRVLDEQLRRRAPAAAEGAGEPAESPLTGADLARFRAGSGLTQRQAAALLGVAHGTVAKAELAADKALGEQLDQALRLVGRA